MVRRIVSGTASMERWSGTAEKAGSDLALRSFPLLAGMPVRSMACRRTECRIRLEGVPPGGARSIAHEAVDRRTLLQ